VDRHLLREKLVKAFLAGCVSLFALQGCLSRAGIDSPGMSPGESLAWNHLSSSSWKGRTKRRSRREGRLFFASTVATKLERLLEPRISAGQHA